jgi:hypothetical protein
MNTVLKPSLSTQRRASRMAASTSWGGIMPAPNMRPGAALQKSLNQSL